MRQPSSALSRAAVRALLCAAALLAGRANAQSDLASERLLDIADEEREIYKKIAEDPDFYTTAGLKRRLNELIQSYRAYLADHPGDVEALVLYGKLLRRVGEKEQAFRAFLKADDIDPQIAVVKQHIGNHLAETGKGKAALTFYLQAVDLAPKTGAYQFGLGQLLFEFRDTFVEEGIYTRETLDRNMLKAFRKAARLEPGNFTFRMRLGEAYYDLANPDWKAAHTHWRKLRQDADTDLRRQIIDLHRARVLGKLGRHGEAKALAASVTRPGLQKSKQQVMAELRSR